jgi:hypothetical protein
MDTIKDKQKLDSLQERGETPWLSPAGAPSPGR